MDNVSQGGLERSVAHNVLERQGRVENKGVDSSRDADNGEAGRNQTARTPDAEGHDWVVDLVLDHNKGNEKDQADDERGQRLGFRPTSRRAFAEIVDDSDNAHSEAGDSHVIDSAISNLGLAQFGGDDHESKEGHNEANDGRDIENPSPACL